MTSLLITFENFDAIWEIRNVVIAGLEISHVKFYAKIALYKLKGKLVTHDISTPAIDTKTGMCGSTSNLGQRHIRLPTHYSFEITVPLMTGTYSYHGNVPWTSLNKFCYFPKWQTLIGGKKTFIFILTTNLQRIFGNLEIDPSRTLNSFCDMG